MIGLLLLGFMIFVFLVVVFYAWTTLADWHADKRTRGRYPPGTQLPKHSDPASWRYQGQRGVEVIDPPELREFANQVERDLAKYEEHKELLDEYRMKPEETVDQAIQRALQERQRRGR